MITMITGLPDGVVGFEANGKVEAADYRDTLVPAIDKAIQENGKVRLLYVLGNDFGGYSLAAMWDDAVVGTRDWSKWEKVAVVTGAGDRASRDAAHRASRAVGCAARQR